MFFISCSMFLIYNFVRTEICTFFNLISRTISFSTPFPRVETVRLSSRRSPGLQIFRTFGAVSFFLLTNDYFPCDCQLRLITFFFPYYRIFSVTIVNTARIIPTIQKRVTILGSGIPCFWKWWWIGLIRKIRRPSPYFFLVYLK